MAPVGRYGVQQQLSAAALWLGVAILAGCRAVLAGALWVIRSVAPEAASLAELTADRIGEVDMVIDVPPVSGGGQSAGVIDGRVVSVRYEHEMGMRS